MLFSPNNCKNSEFNTIIKDKITIKKENKTNINLINKTNLTNLTNLTLINQNAKNINLSTNTNNKEFRNSIGSLLCPLNEEYETTNAIQVNSFNNLLGIDFNKNEENNSYSNYIETNINNEENLINENKNDKNELNQLNNSFFEFSNYQSNLNELYQQQNLYQNECQIDNKNININQLESINQIEQINANSSNQLLEQMKNEICFKQLVNQMNNEVYLNNILMTPNTPELNSSIVSSPEQLLYENININSPESSSSLINVNGNGDIQNYLLTPKEMNKDFPEISMIINSPEINNSNLEMNLNTILNEDDFNVNELNKILTNNGNNQTIDLENKLTMELNNNNNIMLTNNIFNQQEMIGNNIKQNYEIPSELLGKSASPSSQFLISQLMNPNLLTGLSSEYENPLTNEQITQAQYLNNENYNILCSLINNSPILIDKMEENTDSLNHQELNTGNINVQFVDNTKENLNENNNINLSVNEPKIEEEQNEKEIKQENENIKSNEISSCIEGKPFIYVETYEEEENDNDESKTNSKKKYKKKYYVCSICKHKSKRHYNVEVHMKTHEKNRPRPFKCEKCNKYFCRLHDLKRHEIVHNDKMLHCPMCHKKFGRMDSLKRHIGCKSCKKRQNEIKKD